MKIGALPSGSWNCDGLHHEDQGSEPKMFKARCSCCRKGPAWLLAAAFPCHALGLSIACGSHMACTRTCVRPTAMIQGDGIEGRELPLPSPSLTHETQSASGHAFKVVRWLSLALVGD